MERRQRSKRCESQRDVVTLNHLGTVDLPICPKKGRLGGSSALNGSQQLSTVREERGLKIEAVQSLRGSAGHK